MGTRSLILASGKIKVASDIDIEEEFEGSEEMIGCSQEDGKPVDSNSNKINRLNTEDSDSLGDDDEDDEDLDDSEEDELDSDSEEPSKNKADSNKKISE